MRNQFVVIGVLAALLVVGVSYATEKSNNDRKHLEEIIKELENCQENRAEAERLYEASINQQEEPKEETEEPEPVAEPEQVDPIPVKTSNAVTGKASYYYPGDPDGSGSRTANGDHFTGEDMTAAHMTLPFGTKVRVTNPKTGKSVIVRINDRGGFDRLGRVIDLSKAAFQAIAPLSAGVVTVQLEVLS